MQLKLELVFLLARLVQGRLIRAFDIISVPLFACSRSIDSNNALKFPAPKPCAPIR